MELVRVNTKPFGGIGKESKLFWVEIDKAKEASVFVGSDKEGFDDDEEATFGLEHLAVVATWLTEEVVSELEILIEEDNFSSETLQYAAEEYIDGEHTQMDIKVR